MEESSVKCASIEELDHLACLIKDEIPSAESMAKSEMKISKLITAKGKLKMSSIWSEERLENVLYEIENIPYKLRDAPGSVTGSNKKKRVATETSDCAKVGKLEKPDHIITQFNLNAVANSHHISSKNSMAGLVSSTSNSKFAGKKIIER